MYPQQPKSIWRIVFIIILAILVLAEGYFIYKYYSDWKKEKNNSQTIQKQLDDCNKKLKDSQTSTTTKTDETASQSTTCASTLTAADRTEMEGWEDLTSTQNYTFLHPPTWEVKANEADFVSLEDNSEGAGISLQFRSGEMTNTDIDPGFNETDKKTIKVACVEATETFLSQGDERLILVDFEKNNTRHLIFFAYKDIGASMSGDILDAFGRVLKSITFS